MDPLDKLSVKNDDNDNSRLIILVVLFIVFSLPMTDDLLKSFVTNSDWAILFIKAIMFGIIAYILSD